jgi:hypothetical protein
MIRRITLVALPFVLSGSIAHAVTLSTPTIPAGPDQQNECVVTNVGTTPVTLSVDLFNEAGLRVGNVADFCSAVPLAPHRRCFVLAGEDVDVSCVIESSSRNVRAALAVGDISTFAFRTVAVVPATAK